ncbi:hypothetical protein RF11_02404 [Thelohanellus kitauei]|uniref:Uncharacterized protein n=1 Tax=Thelohanellus kitauei TaxID=669202 RepID=A0A0C2NCG5_THEKT|nr:hypothetical protein RF11_02404 [Thelohanellus kitauei]
MRILEEKPVGKKLSFCPNSRSLSKPPFVDEINGKSELHINEVLLTHLYFQKLLINPNLLEIVSYLSFFSRIRNPAPLFDELPLRAASAQSFIERKYLVIDCYVVILNFHQFLTAQHLSPLQLLFCKTLASREAFIDFEKVQLLDISVVVYLILVEKALQDLNQLLLMCHNLNLIFDEIGLCETFPYREYLDLVPLMP